MMKSKTGIIFDVDGTLWDSAEQVAGSWMEVIKTHDELDVVVNADDIRGLMGKTMTDIAHLMFPGFPEEQQFAYLKEIEERENEYLAGHLPPCYEGVREVIEELSKEYPLFIVSNAQVGYIELVIESAGVGEYITDYMCFGDNKQTKDRNIKTIAQRNGLEKYYYVGDIQGDYDATVKAGGEFIYASYGFGEIEQDAPSIADIRDLPALMKNL